MVALRKQIGDEDYATVDALHARFLAMPSNARAAAAPKITEVDQDAGSSDEEDEDEDDDEEMGDAPAPASRERQEPVFDDDGFQVVQKGRRR